VLTELLVAVSVNFSIVYEGCFFLPATRALDYTHNTHVGEDADEVRRTEILSGNNGLYLSVL
jgi:hypothetical protein